jgi:hypothetical protein
MILLIAQWTQPNFFARAKDTGKAQFLTISYSHYAEFARWCLFLGKKVPFEESSYAPGQHVLPVLNFRVNGPAKVISTSSATADLNRTAAAPAPAADEKSPINTLTPEETKKRATAVPALVLPDGRTFADSWSIANEASGLPPLLDQKLVHLYDQSLGPDSRQLIYVYLLKNSNSNIWHSMLTDPSFGRTWSFLYWFVGGGLRNMLMKSFQAADMQAFADCKQRLIATFELIAATRLRGRSTKFINGESMSVEDVALCALAAPVVIPPQYCGGVYAKYFDQALEQDSEFRSEVAYFRNTDVGRYVLSCYAEHRL